MARRPDDEPVDDGTEEDSSWDAGWRARMLRGMAEMALYVVPVLVVIGVIWLASVLYANR